MTLMGMRVALNVFAWFVETSPLVFIMVYPHVKHAKLFSKEQYKAIVAVSKNEKTAFKVMTK